MYFHLRSSDPADYEKIYNFNYWVYVSTGFWKYNSPFKWKENLYKLYTFILVFCYVVVTICFAIDAYLVSKDLEKLSFNLTSTILVFVTMSRLILFSSQQENLKGILHKLDVDLEVDTVGKSKEDREIFRSRAKSFVYVTELFYTLLFVGLPLRIVADTALDTKSYLIPMPFKEKLDPYYELAYGAQVVIIIHFLVTVISHDMFVYGVVVRLIAHLDILEKNFSKIKNLYPRRNFRKYVSGYSECEDQLNVNDVLLRKNNDSEKIQKFLENCGFDSYNLADWTDGKETREDKTSKLLKESIFHHQNILSQVRMFGVIYSGPFSIQLGGACLLIGIVALQIMEISSKITPLLVQQVLYVGTTMMNIFFLCTFGSELIYRSESAANILYDTPWYEMSSENRKIIHFTLKKLQNTPKLKAGGVITVNLETYLKILQNSYNMVAVLKNAY